MWIRWDGILSQDSCGRGVVGAIGAKAPPTPRALFSILGVPTISYSFEVYSQFETLNNTPWQNTFCVPLSCQATLLPPTIRACVGIACVPAAVLVNTIKQKKISHLYSPNHSAMECTKSPTAWPTLQPSQSLFLTLFQVPLQLDLCKWSEMSCIHRHSQHSRTTKCDDKSCQHNISKIAELIFYNFKSNLVGLIVYIFYLSRVQQHMSLVFFGGQQDEIQ